MSSHKNAKLTACTVTRQPVGGQAVFPGALQKRRHAAARTGTVVEEEQDVCSPQKDGARRMPDTEENSTVLRRAPPYGAAPLRRPERGPNSL